MSEIHAIGGLFAEGMDGRILEILHHISDAFQLIDGDWRFVYLNDVARKIMRDQGIDPDAIIGKHVWEEVFLGQSVEPWVTELRRAAAERCFVEFESYFAPWGKWFLVRVHPVSGGGVAIFSQDITEAKLAADRLRGSQSRYQSLFNSIDAGFCICEMITDEQGRGIDYRFIEFNPSFSRLTGLPLDSTGKTARQLVPNLEMRWIDTYARVGLAGETLRFADRSEAMGREFDVFATPLEQRGQFALVFHDVTAQKSAEVSRESIGLGAPASPL